MDNNMPYGRTGSVLDNIIYIMGGIGAFFFDSINYINHYNGFFLVMIAFFTAVFNHRRKNRIDALLLVEAARKKDIDRVQDMIDRENSRQDNE